MANVVKYRNVNSVVEWAAGERGRTASAAVFEGDCESLLEALPQGSVGLAISSPPYCMGKPYERRDDDVDTFIESHQRLLPLVVASLKQGGSLCWQVGFHVEDQVATPLDFLVYEIMRDMPEMQLRNRIVWTFGHGLHCNKRFSGRHETVLWYTKGSEYVFDLDAVRVPQKYPGKEHSAGPKKGKPSGNPAGKNPGDVWDIPNVKGNHVEKTDHPCQFPVGLAQRLIRALSSPKDLVLDPFSGVASTGVAAVVEGRRFLGAEIDEGYVATAEERLKQALKGALKFRPADRAIHVPSPNSKVATRPASFAVSAAEFAGD